MNQTVDVYAEFGLRMLELRLGITSSIPVNDCPL